MKKIKLQIGAHLSTSQGYTGAIDKLSKLNGNCLQIFSGTPLRWTISAPNESEIELFVNEKKRLQIQNVFFHALYLINLADHGAIGQKSVASLIAELNLASKLEINGSIVHTGSFKNKSEDISIRKQKNYTVLIKNIQKVLDNTPDETYLILENSGTRKIGQVIEQLAEIVTDVANKRLRICLDTCHLHAAGYDLKKIDNFDSFLNNFDKKIGLDRLHAIHLNDSRDLLGSLRDRHDNIGEGNVGVEVFRNFLNNKFTQKLPFILEVPGFDNKGPDKINLDLVKKLITV
jgi:deoxyribonuclease-4